MYAAVYTKRLALLTALSPGFALFHPTTRVHLRLPPHTFTFFSVSTLREPRKCTRLLAHQAFIAWEMTALVFATFMNREFAMIQMSNLPENWFSISKMRSMFVAGNIS